MANVQTRLRHVPTQARSRERLQRVLDAADQVLLREAFRTSPQGDRQLLAESKLMLGAYVRPRLA